MKEVVRLYGPDLRGLEEKVHGAEFTLDASRHVIAVRGDKDAKQKVEELTFEAVAAAETEKESGCPVCFSKVEEDYRLEGCGHRSCLVEQCESAMKNLDILPLRCAREGCGAHILVADVKDLLPPERVDELFWAALGKFVASSEGSLRFCPSVYRVEGPPVRLCAGRARGATWSTTRTCRARGTRSLRRIRTRLLSRSGSEGRRCQFCGHAIEKVDGCNHVECRCGKHSCWNCLEGFETSDLCYEHLRSIHFAI